MRETGELASGSANDRSEEDGALAREAARRDAEAWSRIFDRHYRTVFAFLRHRLAGRAEAEDLASQVFEIGYARAHTFDYRGVPIEAWLLGIARNLARDFLRRPINRGQVLPVEEDAMPAVGDSGSAIALRQDLGAAMQHLTEDQQTVITMRFLLDRSVAETATLMERSEDAVKLLQRRALAALQRQLGVEYRQEGVQ